MHLYLLEDSRTDGDLVTRFIQRARPQWQVHVANSLKQARQDPACLKADLLLLDIHLPDGSGLDFLLELRAQHCTQAIVMLTGHGDEESAVRALKAGANDYISKRGDYLERLPQLLEQALLRQQGHASFSDKQLRVLYVEHDAHDIDLTYRHLSRHAPHLQLEVCRSGLECEQRLAEGEQPDVLLVDYRLPGENALELVQRLFSNGSHNLPVVLITGQGNEDVAAQALRLGINDYLVKHPAYLFELPALLERVRRDHQLLLEQRSHHHSLQNLRLHAAAFQHSHNGILITDLRQRICSVNPALCQLTGYREDELLGQRPSILSSGLQDEAFYQELWQALINEGVWEGQLWDRHKNGELRLMRISISRINDQNGLPKHYVAVYTDLSQLQQAQSQLQRLSHYDALTDLPNRLLITTHLEHWLELAHNDDQEQHSVAVLHVDLDNFNLINDSLGQRAGNKLLKAFARRVQRTLSAQETLGRLGSDEFVLLLSNCHAEQAAQRAQALLACCAEPFRLDGQAQYIHACIGISLSRLDASAELLLEQADAALHKAKQRGQQQVAFYREHDGQHAREHLALENRLRQALNRNEFQLYYQPLARLDNRQIIGAEALLRWLPNEGPSVGPAEFIPLLEDSGLIASVGQWVLEQACEQAQRWRNAGFALQTMAINLSPAQLKLAPVLSQVEQTLAITGLPPNVLELEVTESGLLENSQQTLKVLNQLRDLGVRIAVDDFGTGYSSLAYLSQLPLDKLKIDRSFVMRLHESPRDASIVRAIIAMAQELGLHILAEGVESAEQAQHLSSLGAQLFQGFWLSPAIPAECFAEQFLSRQSD
ncbi:two-component system response regulator [Atopomonas hussainii]|uniref:two-component system response regulator n=1 Tax=Atopomonas hussainii TaxID=1429083 RepID=UPI0009001B96|nr:EAL domain-containing protein [Atopomonas hussainii]